MPWLVFVTTDGATIGRFTRALNGGALCRFGSRVAALREIRPGQNDPCKRVGSHAFWRDRPSCACAETFAHGAGQTGSRKGTRMSKLAWGVLAGVVAWAATACSNGAPAPAGATGRPTLAVTVVLDVSGSMDGARIDNARGATEAIVGRLEAADHFSLVTFSDDSTLVVADGPVGPRRRSIASQIHAIAANGATNLAAGLDRGYEQARARGIPEDAVRIVLLLSDGHANAGDTDFASLTARAAAAWGDGVRTSSFGLGLDFDSALMTAIAERGGGGYYFLAEASQIEPAFAAELGSARP
jgi:Mg-chelatase subunit ChlD